MFTGLSWANLAFLWAFRMALAMNRRLLLRDYEMPFYRAILPDELLSGRGRR
jgi:hypothetical protein